MARGASRARHACPGAWAESREGEPGVHHLVQMGQVLLHACGPKSPDSHRVVWGLTSRPPVLLRTPSGFPSFALRLFPSPAFPGSLVGFPAFGVLRSGPFGRCSRVRFPFGSPPLSNPHASTPARRFRGHWSRAAGTEVTSSGEDPWRQEGVRPGPVQAGNARRAPDAWLARLCRAFGGTRRCLRTGRAPPGGSGGPRQGNTGPSPAGRWPR